MSDIGIRLVADAAGLQQSLGQAALHVKGFADSSESSLKSMAQVYEAALTKLATAGKSASEAFKIRGEIKGIDPAQIAPYVKELELLEDKVKHATSSLGVMGVSAKATSAALRGVPAQLTDIVVGLQAGQAPMTVLLQQGGQLKDMFGGIVPAARALGGYVAGLVNPFTLAAAAAGALGYAYYKGSQEADAYRGAIVLSGNAAGVTAGQLQVMAKAVGSVVGTTGAAAGALAQFAASGAVGAANMQKITAAALEFEKYAGQSVAETVKQFVELGKAPVEASVRLNESTNFLTASLYLQVRALQEQGKYTEAAALAQKAWSDAQHDRSDEIKANLGTIERGWNAITAAIKSAGDALLGIGRADGTDVQLQKQREIVSRLERGYIARDQRSPHQFYSGPSESALRNAQQLLASMEKGAGYEALNAASLARRAELTKVLIGYDKDREQYKTKEQRRDEEINRATERGSQLVAAGLLEQRQLELDIASIREKYADKPKQTDGASALQRMREAARNYLADLQAQAQAAETVAAQGNALTKEQEALAKAEEMVREGRVRSKDIDRDAIIAAARRIDLAAEQKRTQEDLNKATLDAARAHDAYIVSLGAAAQKLQDDVAAQRDATARLGLSKEAVAELDAAKLELLATDKELLAIKALDRNEDTLAYEALKAQAQGYRDLAQAKREYASKDAALELERESTKAADAAQAEWQKAADKIQDSITDALMRGFESGKGFAENLRDTVVNMFKTMVLRPIVEFGVRGGLTALGLGGLSGAANASSAVGSLSNLPSLSQLSGWFTDFGGTVTTGIIRAGEYAYQAGFESVGRSMMQLQEASNFSAVANGLNQVGNGLGYLNAAVAASQGKWGQAAGSAIGTYLGGPLGSIVGSTVGGWVDSAFGGGHEYTTGTGLKVATGSGGTLVRNYQNWKNDGSSGFFGIGASGSSSGTNYSAADKATAATISAQAADLRKTYGEYAKVIGGDAQAIMDYYKEFSVALGSDAEANKKAVAAMFGEFADGLATAATATKEYGLSWYAREGETAGATLQRLATSLSAVNGWLDVFNDSLGNTEAVLTRAQQASVLVDQFGGLDAFNAASSAYYQAMYSEQERMEKAAQAMAKVFLELNVAAPQTIEQYNALRNSLDLMTDEGRKAYATLTKMGPQFAQVANYAEAAADKMAAAVQAQLDKDLDSIRTWAGKLAVLQGTTTERQLQLQADLASATNDTTRQLIAQVYAMEDLKTAAEKAAEAQAQWEQEVERLGTALEQAKSTAASTQNAVDAVRNEATSAYLQALQSVGTAQEALNRAQAQAQLDLVNAQIDAQIEIARAANEAAKEMQSLGTRLREFVTGATASPGADFGRLLAQALAGDKAAMQALPDAANAAIELAQERSSSATAFALAKADIVGKVASVAALAERLGAATVAVPERVSAPEQDPVAAATAELAAAQTKLTQTLSVANAISAPLTASVTDLIAKFTAAQADNAKALADVAAAQTALDAIKAHTASTASGVGTVASTGTQQLTQLTAIATSTANTVANLASYATGAQQTVAFAANDPIYSVFANISRTNELLIDAQQLTLHTLLGVAINEDLTAAGAFNSVFQGTYSVQFDSLQVLHNILWQAQVANSKLEAVAVAAAQSKDLQSATVGTLIAQYNHAQYISAAGQYVRFARTAPGTDVFATGGVFTNSIVTRPTSFRLGQMGEAGPEAIMPLANINGSLGVRAAGFDLGPLLEELNALRAEVAALRKENSAENRAALYHLANTADATGSIKRNGVQVFTDASEPLLTQVAA